MRVFALALATAGALVATGTASNGRTAVRVAYWANGSTVAPDGTWSLRCNPSGGTLPHPKTACARLARSGTKLLAPTPPGVACTEIYGGPEKARIVGVVQGRRVWVTVTRSNGCEIDRWNRLSPWLLPAPGATG